MTAFTLPPEVIAIIISYLADNNGYTPNKLAPYAAVSRVWQASIERHTFSRLRLTSESLQTAPTVLDCRRLSAVRSVDVTVLLPSYDVAARSRVETDADRAANNAVFTQTVQDLFRLFARGAAEGAFGPDAQVVLTLTARSPSDHAPAYIDGRLTMEYLSRRFTPRDGDLREARYACSALELVGGDADTGPALPLLPMMTKFACHPQSWKRYIAPAACVQLAARLPRLRSAEWSFSDNEKRDLAGRRARRAAFARVLPRLPPSLDEVSLELRYDVKNDLFRHPIPLLDATSDDPAAAHDSLSAALGRWARRSVEFRFHGTVTMDFWTALVGDADGGDASDDARTPARTALLTVGLSKVSPTGQWLLVLPPLAADDDPDRFDYRPYYDEYAFPLGPGEAMPEDVPENGYRVLPDPKLWNQILSASGRAVAHLPQLRDMSIRVPGGGSVCEMTFLADKRAVTFASYPCEPGADSLSPSSMDQPLDVPNLFRPEEDVVQTWRAATKAQCGGVEADSKSVNITSQLYERQVHLEY